MKTISDAAGIAGKRGVRILIPAQHRAPESDSQRRLASHPGASSGHPHHEGAKFCFVEVNFLFGASFEWACAFFYETIGISCGTEIQNFPLFGPGASCGPEIQLQAHFFGPSLGNGELEALVGGSLAALNLLN